MIDRQRDGHTETEREIDRLRDGYTETERQTERQMDIERQRG